MQGMCSPSKGNHRSTFRILIYYGAENQGRGSSRGLCWVQSAFTFSDYKCVLFKLHMLVKRRCSCKVAAPPHPRAPTRGPLSLQSFSRAKAISIQNSAFSWARLGPGNEAHTMGDSAVSRSSLCLSFWLYYFGVTLFVFPWRGCCLYDRLRPNVSLVAWLLFCCTAQVDWSFFFLCRGATGWTRTCFIDDLLTLDSVYVRRTRMLLK